MTGSILLLSLIVSSPVTLTEFNNPEGTSLAGHWEYLLDPSDGFTVDEVQAHSGFKPSLKDVPNFGFTDDVYWLRTTIVNQTDLKNWVVEIGYPLLDNVSLYFLTANNPPQVFHGGDHLNFDQRHRPHRALNFGVDLLPGEESTLVLRVQTSSSLQVPIRLYSERSFGDHMADDATKTALLYGILLVMIFFNGFLWLSLRDSTYGYYVLFLTTFMGLLTCLHGTFFQWVLPNAPQLANTLVPTLQFLTLGAVAWFTARFLTTRNRMKRFHKFLKTTTIICAVGAVACWFAPYTMMVRIFVPLMIVSLLILLWQVTLSTRTFRPAKYFLASFLAMIGGSIIFALVTVGLLPTNAFTSNAFAVGAALQVTLLSLALADRIQILQAEKTASQGALIKSMAAYGEEVHRREELQSQNDLLAQEMAATGQALIQADKMASLGQLVAGVAHEIAGPTNYVGLAMGLIRDRIADVRKQLEKLLGKGDPKSAKVLATFTTKLDQADAQAVQAQNGIERIQNIHSALRNHGRVDPKFSSNLELDSIVQETLVILGNKVKHVDVQVEMNGAPSFAARRSQVGQVLANLIGNACDASQQQLGDDNGGANSGLPKLIIEAQEKLRNEVNCLWVEIHDSGPGIPEELREKILEPFFTTKEVGMGTGLGMPIVQRILESHGGGLQIGDSALLGGACMAFWIPREQVQETDETV